jgi:peptide deformylase
MILEVVQYGHPVLRQKGAPIASITPEIHRLIADMLDTMRAAKGVGLAAQQVGRALQLTVIDVRGVTDRPSTLQIGGKDADLAAHMPMVLINAEAQPAGDDETGTEGCLSFPEVFGEIKRAAKADVTAMDEKGREMEFRAGGLLARAIQHELDHLNGILFIDRMSRAERTELKPRLEELQTRTKAALNAAK